MTYSVRNIAIALALAVAAAAAVLLYTSSYKDQVTRDQERVKVMVANQDIPAGTPGEKASGMMAAKEVLRTDVTPGALQSSAGLEGKVAAHDVYADQQVVAQVFRTPTDQAAALSLDKTERGIRVNVDFASGALGAIKAGDHVDYFATFSVKPPGDTAGNLFFTRRLMTDVRVLEAPVPDAESGPGKLSEEDKDTKQQTLMLAVTQADATKLAFIEALKKGDGAAVVSWVVVRPPEGQAVRDADHGREPQVDDRGRRPAQRAEDEVLELHRADRAGRDRRPEPRQRRGLGGRPRPDRRRPDLRRRRVQRRRVGGGSNPPAELEPPADTDPDRAVDHERELPHQGLHHRRVRRAGRGTPGARRRTPTIEIVGTAVDRAKAQAEARRVRRAGRSCTARAAATACRPPDVEAIRQATAGADRARHLGRQRRSSSRRHSPPACRTWSCCRS